MMNANEKMVRLVLVLLYVIVLSFSISENKSAKHLYWDLKKPFTYVSHSPQACMFSENLKDDSDVCNILRMNIKCQNAKNAFVIKQTYIVFDLWKTQYSHEF